MYSYDKLQIEKCHRNNLESLEAVFNETNVSMVKSPAKIDRLKLYLVRMERALTDEVLKRLSPNEAKLLRDPAMQARVRFR
jgi:hypothetical protein